MDLYRAFIVVPDTQGARIDRRDVPLRLMSLPKRDKWADQKQVTGTRVRTFEINSLVDWKPVEFRQEGGS